MLTGTNRTLTQGCCMFFEQILEANSYNNDRCTATYHPSEKPSNYDEEDKVNILKEVKTNTSWTTTNGQSNINRRKKSQ